MRYLTFIFCLNFTYLFAFDNLYIANAIKEVSKKKQIDSRVLYTIVDIESGFKPFSIGLSTNEENAKEFLKLRSKKLKIIASEYKENKWNLSFLPISNSYLERLKLAKSIARAFKVQGFNFDVGLAQINATNFQIEEIDYIFDPRYNLLKSATILNGCQNLKESLKDIIECYNYGTKKRSSYLYYKRFEKSYYKNFGDN
ncbi:conjugal transfer protein [Malaciobacter mytili]|uniref:transglycosylase SLT domain-containing protein n=1 Tax=Malaciobacter mytili TaxID=603050 RepID=UPI00100A4AB1|nr:transglycosylase SLT domain-containing protein [Malaciobacter mytili]RXI43424.1 conjugal transfer protein [Malaciobacter mytili]